MLGMQKEEKVYRRCDFGRRHIILPWLGEHHVQEIFRVTVFRLRFIQRQPASDAITVRGNGPNLCHGDGCGVIKMLEILLMIVGRNMRIVGAKRIHTRRQYRHRVSRVWKSTHEAHHFFREIGFCTQAGGKSSALVRIRQFAIDHQISDIDKIGLFSQLLDRVSAIAEDSFFSVDKRNLALAGACIAKTLIKRDIAGGGAKLAHINRLFILRPYDYGQFEFFVVNLEGGGL